MVEPAQVTADQLHLTPSQQHYLYRVLRLRPGQQFLALDGLGTRWLATLTATAEMASIVPALPDRHLPPADLTLVAALPKGNGFDEVVRQATELGVTTLQPVISDRTLAQPSPNKLERWGRIAAEATEQSERLLLPQILASMSWRDYLSQTTTGSRWICVARGDAPHLLAAALSRPAAEPATIATGPEGGWTEAEVEAAIAAGFETVSLGPQILRAVTAPLAALTLITAARRLEDSLKVV
ncbi:16S rRNA (uracil(1498)-N(3))-methyltransferase [Nodosilinea sp. LEGE 07088]|uniref:16S rRNA (uracil(1498)-N(3))-methyltransferase n=1 Tax=Nodosilinea sp. LEGE 07088 TaxID=2777968 RepID=UPI00187F2BD8|nr:16S rRNA (uracil(1498)-N(3))-methyltransferase [Nodosilinea sp. LEGE 07088]MBE9141153.1 16S rRNA (uracil(1498)-N(3))-methyltransferase [Nodosilinea sp. LEGE 07088]